MATKTDRLEARVSPVARHQIELAASIAGVSMSAFMVQAAVERAAEVISESEITDLPAQYFDRLLAALDEPDPALRLAKAADAAGRSRRITLT